MTGKRAADAGDAFLDDEDDWMPKGDGTVPMPRKRLYRARAHSNPLNDGVFTVPQCPTSMDWEKHYPKFFGAGEGAGEGRKVSMIDVGCGFGGLLLRLGPLFPQELVLGMEIRDKVSHYVSDRIDALRKGPGDVAGAYQNISVVRTNAMKYLPNYFEKGTLKKVFFLFADPHFKKTNHRRRIVQRQLLAEYAHLLEEGGMLYTISDVEDLADWNSEKLEEHPLFERVPEEELKNDPVAKLLYESTEEGQKVKRNEGNTWRHVFRRVANPKLGVYSPAA